ncbi:hypothetical protein ACQEVG_01620 [Streptomyces sp. CA-135486]|uniref:hypothetical protein n=1 Tax=Streptomyces sp. CA-135486 TaxID=3240049 RepID=UPI003D93D1B3
MTAPDPAPPAAGSPTGPDADPAPDPGPDPDPGDPDPGPDPDPGDPDPGPDPGGDPDPEPEPEPDGGAATAPEPPRGAGLTEFIGTVGSLISLFTAVLFYFGWSSTDAEAKALGLRDTVFHFSTRDYLLRSVDALYLPVLLGAAAAFAALAAHRRVQRDPGAAATPLRVLRHAWAPPLLLLPLIPLHPALFDLLVPLTTIAGFLLTGYARTRESRDLRMWALCLLVAVLALFWAVSSYAGIVGRGRAALTARTVDTGMPAVAVFSKDDLLIHGRSSCRFTIAGKASAFRYRYAGLRLFHVSGDRIFLVSRGWSPTQGTMFVVEESEKLRVEYVSGDGPRSAECPAR